MIKCFSKHSIEAEEDITIKRNFIITLFLIFAIICILQISSLLMILLTLFILILLITQSIRFFNIKFEKNVNIKEQQDDLNNKKIEEETEVNTSTPLTSTIKSSSKRIIKISTLINSNLYSTSKLLNDYLSEYYENNAIHKELKSGYYNKEFSHNKHIVKVDLLRSSYLYENQILQIIALEETANIEFNQTKVTFYLNIANLDLLISTKNSNVCDKKNILLSYLNDFFELPNLFNLYTIDINANYCFRNNIEEKIIRKKNILSKNKMEKLSNIFGFTEKETPKLDSLDNLNNLDKVCYDDCQKQIEEVKNEVNERSEVDNSEVINKMSKQLNSRDLKLGLDDSDKLKTGIDSSDVKYVEVADEGYSIFVEQYENGKWDEWEDDMKKKTFKTWSRDDDKGRRAVKAVITINKPLTEVYEYIRNIDNKKKFDKGFDSGKVEKKLNENYEIAYLKFKGKIGISPRDFRIVTRCILKDDIAQLFGCSIPSTDEVKGCVRAKLIFSSYDLEKVSDDQTKVTFHALSEIHLSQWMANLALKDLTHTLLEIKRLNEKK